MCKILKVGSLLGLLAFCAAEGMQTSSEPKVAKESGTGVKLEISRSSAFEIKEVMLKLTNLNAGTVTYYQKDEISEQIDKSRVGELKFNDGRVEYFTGMNIPENWFNGDTSLESIVIPPTVRSIGVRAFSGCDQLKEVTLGSWLQKIGRYAFSGTAINKITIPNSVKAIGLGAFKQCSQLQEVILGSQLRQIASWAFSGTAINRITIPDSVKIIEPSVFADCYSLQEVILGSQLQLIGECAFLNAAIKELIIPKTVKVICSGAFSGNQLNEVVFLGNPDEINIAQDAFPGNVTRVYSNGSKK